MERPKVLGCLFLSSLDNVLACLPPHISELHFFFTQQTVDSEINSSKRFDSCPGRTRRTGAIWSFSISPHAEMTIRVADGSPAVLHRDLPRFNSPRLLAPD